MRLRFLLNEHGDVLNTLVNNADFNRYQVDKVKIYEFGGKRWQIIIEVFCFKSRSDPQLLYLVILEFLKYVFKECLGFKSAHRENALGQVSGLQMYV